MQQNQQQHTHKKFVAKGHDAILKNAQDAADTIVITLMSGDIVSGRLINRDKFTITVETNTNTRLTVYKHGIEMFRITKREE